MLSFLKINSCLLIETNLIIIVTSSFHIINQRNGPESSFNSVKCYSCMSQFYEGLWGVLQHTYRRPANFSQHCDYPYDQKGIGLVECPSICIKMWEDTQIGGYPVRGFIRGCFDSMLQRGFNQTLVRWYRWLQRDSCHVYDHRHVLQIPIGHADVSKQQVYLCTCYADGCNGSPNLSSSHSFYYSIPFYVWMLVATNLLITNYVTNVDIT